MASTYATNIHTYVILLEKNPDFIVGKSVYQPTLEQFDEKIESLDQSTSLLST